MAHTVSRRPLTAESRVHAPVNPCWICGGQSGTGTGFSPSSSILSCQLFSILIHNLGDEKWPLVTAVQRRSLILSISIGYKGKLVSSHLFKKKSYQREMNDTTSSDARFLRRNFHSYVVYESTPLLHCVVNESASALRCLRTSDFQRVSTRGSGMFTAHK
jgi:hypothetical protein